MATKKAPQDICDYIDWRGDLPFAAAPFNEVDALIFCQLAYADFSSLSPADFSRSVPLAELSSLFFASEDFAERSDLGLLIDPRTNDLLKKAGGSVRYGSVRVTGFVSEYDRAREEQFSAVTFCFEDGKLFTAFRGTDDTLIGWKEDFNLAFLDSVPAQEDARAYLARAAEAFPRAEITAGGHSKGGNLAIYAAAHLADAEKARLAAVYNFDGPGFSRQALESAAFRSVQEKVQSVFPQFSIIGMLFHHYDGFAVVPSTEKLVMQHNPFSWAVKGAAFERKDGLDGGSSLFFTSFNRWFESLEKPQREQFVETLFGVLLATDARTNSELSRDLFKNAGKIIKAFAGLDPGIRDEAIRIAGEFVKTITKEGIGLPPE